MKQSTHNDQSKNMSTAIITRLNILNSGYFSTYLAVICGGTSSVSTTPLISLPSVLVAEASCDSLPILLRKLLNYYHYITLFDYLCTTA